jgi:radical SAM protein with 4Fe4S-binding SPASM domain
MNQEKLFPITSGKVTIKKTPKEYYVRDRESKKDLSVNKDLAQILLLCTGQNNFRDITKKIIQQKNLDRDQISEKTFKILHDLNKEGIIYFSGNKTFVPIRFRETDFEFPLDTVYLEPTKKCNFPCIHCFASSPKFTREIDEKREMSLKDYEIVIKKIDEMGILGVCITGGEPFLRKDTFDIIHLLNEANIEFGILSNGYFLDKQKIQELQRLAPKFIGISFDSHREEIFEQIRGSNKYMRVLTNIDNLIESGLDPNINCILFRGLNDSYEHIKDYLKFLKERGIPAEKITFDEMVPEGEASNKRNFLIDEESTIFNIRKAYRKVFDIDFFTMKNPEYLNTKASFCGLGDEICYINSFGDISLCPALTSKEYVAGNILKDDLKEVWEKSNIFNYFRNKEYFKDSKCSTCSSLDSCFGGCRAKSKTFFGTFNAIDPWMCAFYKE